jgi:cytochrome c
VIRAAYTDRPVGPLPAQTSVVTRVLRSPVLTPAAADILNRITFGATGSGDGAETRSVAVTAMHGAHLGYRQVDLTGIRSVVINANTAGEMRAAGGTIDVRVGTPTGPILGQGTVPVAPPRGRGAAPAPPPATTITLKPTTGVHDVYFVFTNPQALAGQALMTISSITVE